jgi:hypothetical protein
MNVGFAYPFGICPWDFGGYEFEVRQNGRLRALAQKPQCVPRRTMPFVFRSSKLPLHLVYQFDAPGTYEVRLSGPILSPDQTTVVRTGRSDWVPIIVQPYADEKRAAWLKGMQEKAAKPSEWQQSGELIPSLLAWPDEQALIALLLFLPQPVVANSSRPILVNGNPSHVMNCVAPAALAAFPEALLMKYISAKRLEQLRSPNMWCP